jgi:hypothetical protein
LNLASIKQDFSLSTKALKVLVNRKVSKDGIMSVPESLIKLELWAAISCFQEKL